MTEYEIKQKYESFYKTHTAQAVAEFNAHRIEYRNLVWAEKCFYLFVTILIMFLLGCIAFSIWEDALDQYFTPVCMTVFVTEAVLLAAVYRLAPNQRDFSDIDPEAEIKKALMPKFVKIFGDFNWQKKRQNLIYDFTALRQTKIIPQNITVQGDDCVSGKYENVGVKITEINVGQNSLLGWLVIIVMTAAFGAVLVTILTCIFGFIGLFVLDSPTITLVLLIMEVVAIFLVIVAALYFITTYFFTAGKLHGVLIELDMPKTFSGHTFLYEKAISSRSLRCQSKTNYSKVLLEDADFNRRYVVYSTNQVEARYVLTPVFMESIKNIVLAFSAQFYRLSFQNNKMLLLASTKKDLLTMGSIYKDTDKETFDTIYKEMNSILHLIDVFNLKSK